MRSGQGAGRWPEGSSRRTCQDRPCFGPRSRPLGCSGQPDNRRRVSSDVSRSPQDCSAGCIVGKTSEGRCAAPVQPGSVGRRDVTSGSGVADHGRPRPRCCCGGGIESGRHDERAVHTVRPALIRIEWIHGGVGTSSSFGIRCRFMGRRSSGACPGRCHCGGHGSGRVQLGYYCKSLGHSCRLQRLRPRSCIQDRGSAEGRADR